MLLVGLFTVRANNFDGVGQDSLLGQSFHRTEAITTLSSLYNPLQIWYLLATPVSFPKNNEDCSPPLLESLAIVGLMAFAASLLTESLLIPANRRRCKATFFASRSR